jgi:hypothetical protein
MKILSLLLVMIIVACAVMIGYLLLYIPYECRNLAITSGGTTTCGLEPGAYVIAGISGIIAIAAAFMLIRGQKKNHGT